MSTCGVSERSNSVPVSTTPPLSASIPPILARIYAARGVASPEHFAAGESEFVSRVGVQLDGGPASHERHIAQAAGKFVVVTMNFKRLQMAVPNEFVAVAVKVTWLPSSTCLAVIGSSVGATFTSLTSTWNDFVSEPPTPSPSASVLSKASRHSRPPTHAG